MESPTKQLLEYISVFLDKNLSQKSLHLIRANILTEVLAYREAAIKEFCNDMDICRWCGEKDDNHDPVCGEEQK